MFIDDNETNNNNNNNNYTCTHITTNKCIVFLVSKKTHSKNTVYSYKQTKTFKETKKYMCMTYAHYTCTLNHLQHTCT